MNDPKSAQAATEAAPAASEQRLVSTEYQLRRDWDSGTIMPVTFHRMRSPFYPDERWSVRLGCQCLSVTGEWEWEPIPSERRQAFYDRCRFKSLDAALEAYDRANRRTQRGRDAEATQTLKPRTRPSLE